jgi:hypothetical protein
VGEKNGPVVADPVMKVDRTFRGLGVKVRGGIADRE